MAWSTPRTWVPSEVVNAGNMNTYISDDLTYLKSSVDSLVVGAGAYSLPAANSMPSGGKHTVKATGGTLTISRAGADTIWSATSGQTSVVAAAGDAYTFASDGVNIWYVV